RDVFETIGVLNHHGAANDRTDPHDAHLGLEEDRGVEQRTPRTGVGDRERATGQLVGRGLVITGAGCKVGDLPRQTGDVEVARVLEYRHDESAFGVDGDPDVLRAVVDDLLAFDGGVEFRDRKSTRLNSSHVSISYAVFCLK